MTEFDFNVDAMINFLVDLLNTPSPTGYTVEGMNFLEKQFSAMGIDGLTITQTPKGALRLYWPGVAKDARRALTAHVDTLGLMVKQIKANGRLETTQLGGYVWSAVEFEGVTIRGFDGKLHRGTALPINPSVHVNRTLRETRRNAEVIEIRIDARIESAADVEALGIGVGDFVFLDTRTEVTDTGFIRSRHLDDKASVASIFGAMMAIRDAGVRPAQDTYILIANYEEVGHGGSHGIPDSVEELLAVDMGALGDGQAGDEYSVSICVKDSSGPYHHEFTSRLRTLADNYEIAHKVDIYPYYGSDGSAYWRAGGGARVGLVGPGVDASHGYERTHQDSLLHTAHLLARYLTEV